MTETRNEYIDNLAKVWMSTVAGGVIICLIGAAAIIVPAFFTLAITWLIGIGALIVSAVEFFRMIRYAKASSSWWWPLGSCLLTLALGLLILFNPTVSAISLTLLMVIFFLADGVWTLVFAFRLRPLNGWLWTVMSGIASIVVAILIWLQLPSSAIWAVGLLVGIRFLFTGSSLILLGLAAKSFVSRLQTKAA